MQQYLQPISLILMAGNALSIRPNIRQILSNPERIFVESANQSDCLDLAEWHRPNCVFLCCESINDEIFILIKALKFLQIQSILIVEEITQNKITINYCLNLGAAALFQYPPERDSFLKAVHLAIQHSMLGEYAIETARDEMNISLDDFLFKGTDQFQDLVNEGIRQAIEVLEELLAENIEIQLSQLKAVSKTNLQKILEYQFGKRLIALGQLAFAGVCAGTAQLLFSVDNANTLISYLLEESPDSEEFQQLKVDTLVEVGNMALNSAIGYLSNAFQDSIEFSVPVYREDYAGKILQDLGFGSTSTIILSLSHFEVRNLNIEGDFCILFQSRSLINFIFGQTLMPE